VLLGAFGCLWWSFSLESGRQIHHHCRCIHAECPSLRSQGAVPVKLWFHVVFQRDQTRMECDAWNVTPAGCEQHMVSNRSRRLVSSGALMTWWQPQLVTCGDHWLVMFAEIQQHVFCIEDACNLWKNIELGHANSSLVCAHAFFNMLYDIIGAATMQTCHSSACRRIMSPLESQERCPLPELLTQQHV